jgi:hypothetical protein
MFSNNNLITGTWNLYISLYFFLLSIIYLESFEDIFTEESEEFESYTSEDEVVQEGSEVDKNEKVFEKTESVPVSHETELQVNKDLKEKNSIGDLQNDIQSLTIKEAVTKKEFSAEVLKENSLEKPFSSREYRNYIILCLN